MELKLNNEQFRELLIDVVIGTYIREAVLDARGEDFEDVGKLQEYLLFVAKDFNAEDMVENFKGSLIPSEKVCEEYHDKNIEEYNDNEFWHRLETDLGKRDFLKTLTDEERKKIEKDGWLPDRVNEFYDRYAKEFEKHGIERLYIKE